MGSIWLDGRTPGYPNVVDVLRAGGLTVVEFEGWKTRSRSSGGFNALAGVVHHHTASKTSPANDLNYMVYGCPDAPVSNGLLDRTGTFTVIAGGAANHAGKGGPRGSVPLDSGNSYCFGIEAANNGVGEPWPKAQTDAYLKMTVALAAAYGLPITAPVQFSHAEWTSRKIDPAGPSPWPTINSSQTWDMNAYRASAAELAAGGGPGPADDDDDDDLSWLLDPLVPRRS